MQGNQKRLCGSIMRSNCCSDSHPTTRRVSYKKHKQKQWSAIVVVVVVVMRRPGVQRSEARSRGVEHRFGKYVDSPSTREWEGCIFGFFHPETRFQKSVFSIVAFSGAVWTVSQNDAIHVLLCMKTQKRLWTATEGSWRGNSSRITWGRSEVVCGPSPVSDQLAVELVEMVCG